MNKIIIGAGITGLLWKFYFPEWELISPPALIPGGKPAADPFSRSYMIWLHDTPETRTLMDDLKIPQPKSRVATIGYWNSGWISDRLTPEISSNVVHKKMTPWNEEIKPVSDIGKLSTTGFTEGTNFMKVLDIDLGFLITALRRRCEVTNGYAVEIRDNLLGVSNQPNNMAGTVFSKFDLLISTIPAPIFENAWNLGHNLDTRSFFQKIPTSNFILKVKPDEFAGDYDMIYYDKTFPFSRISKLRNRYCMEFTGILSKTEFLEMYPHLNHKIFDYFVMPMGRIINRNLIPPDNVIFSGRFAKWDSNITTEHTIKQILEYKNATQS